MTSSPDGKKLSVSDRVKALRRALGLTQKDFAELLGTSPARVNAWERRRSRPGPDYGAALAAHANAPVSDFYEEAAPPVLLPAEEYRALLAEREVLQYVVARLLPLAREEDRVEIEDQLRAVGGE